MTNSLADLEMARAILVIGSNTTEQHPVAGTILRRAARHGAKIIVADPRTIDLARHAAIHLRQRPGTDTALLNGLAHIILKNGWEDREFIAARTENFDEWSAAIEKYTPAYVSELTGVPEADLYRAAELYARNSPAAIVYAMGITQHTSGHQNVLAVANLALLTGNIGKPGAGVNPLRGQNNVQGACDVGALPNFYTAYQRVTDPAAREKLATAWGVPLPEQNGLTVLEMLNAAHAGLVKGMWIIGENPAMSDPDSAHVREALESLELLVVQDLFLTETAELAHVVLPAASFAEKDGTFTSTERRVQRVRKAVDPPGAARTDWEIVSDVARHMLQVTGHRSQDAGQKPQDTGALQPATCDRQPATWNYQCSEGIWRELTALTPSYAGITYARLETSGLQWPVPNVEHPGTPILHREKFIRGLGRFSPVDYIPPAENPDADYPLILTTGRVLAQFHTGSMTHKVAGLEALAPEERVEVSIHDAARVGLADGDWVSVTSRRGQVRVRAHVTRGIKPGVVFMTFHYASALSNMLTNPAFDPVAKIPELKVCAVRVERASPPRPLS